jgi:hypothetical protein
VSNLRLLVSYGKDYVRGTGAAVEGEEEDEEEGTASQPHQLSPAPAVTAEMSPNPAYGVSSSDSSVAL